MKIIDLQKQTATVTSAATVVLSATAADKFRTVADAVAANEIAANATDVAFFVRNPANGAHEVGKYTISISGGVTTLTQTERLGSSNGGAAVNFGGATCDVYSAAPASMVNAMLSAADGVTGAQLTQIAVAARALVVDANGNIGTGTASVVNTFLGVAVDTTPPTFVSAQVANSTPTVVQVTMSETLGATAPPASALAVTKNSGSAVSVTNVTTSGAVMLVTVASAFVSTDTGIQVTYTKPSNGNLLTDAAATPNAAASFGPSAATNNVAPAGDITKPTPSSAAVANATPTKVDITASEALSATYSSAASCFTVGGHTVSSVSVNGSTITLTVDAFVNGEAARTVAYAPNGTNDIRDLAGNTMNAFTGLSITNNVAAASVAYTYTQLFSQTIPSTINASSSTLYGAYRQIVPSTSKTDYWQVKTTSGGVDAPSVIGGWSTSATVPPASASDNSPGNNGYRTLSYSGGNFTSDAILWAQNGAYYWWMKASDGAWTCLTPSGVAITGA